MRKDKLIIDSINLLVVVLLYYITRDKNIFIYVLSLCVYNIFDASLEKISFRELFLSKNKKIFDMTLLTISFLSIIFLLISIILSDITSSILKIENTFLVFLMMGISIICRPLLNILLDYFSSTKRKKMSVLLYNIYYYLDVSLLLIISIIVFKIFNISTYIGVSMMYLSKIISISIVILLSYKTIHKDLVINKNNEVINKKFYIEIKKILTNTFSKSIINIVKNSYYYLSIIILYLILTTRYSYASNVICIDLTFIYFYFLIFINYLVLLVNYITIKKVNKKDISLYVLKNIEIILPTVIILSIISPLICKIVFNDGNYAKYLVPLNILAIFISLYDITTNNLTNKKNLYISLFIGLLIKIITSIPLINSFYRMGYNLIYGDILSTIISMSFSIIVCYLSIDKKIVKGQIFLEEILNIIYENIKLSIVLIMMAFIIPIKSDNYLYSVLIMIVYLITSYIFLMINNKYLKKEKR